MSALLALCSSLLWGASDFLGGTVTRRLPALSVIGVSQLVALIGLLPIAVLTGELDASTQYLGWALAAGIVGLIALTSFYRALAAGTMGVVAPIASLGIVVPVVVGLLAGESPSRLQLAGVGLAVVGIVLTGGPDRTARATAGRGPLVLAGVAAAGFGAVLVLVAHGSATSAIMTLVTMRATTVTLLGLVALRSRTGTGVTLRDLPLVAVIGTGDVGANAAYAVASQSGLVSVVAVLASLYPAVTALLAWQVHGERLTRTQLAGVVTVLVGVVLLAGG